MASYLALFLGAMGAGALREGKKRYNVWREERNALPDDIRAQIYWNDRRYERLRWWLVWGYPITLVAVVATVFFYMWLTLPAGTPLI